MLKNNLMKEKKILICDDDRTVSDFLKRFFMQEGYLQIETVLSGEEALERVAKEPYQLVLLDIKLPGISGLQTLQRIKEINNNIGVIMITGFPEMETTKQAMEMGAYDYIVKPFDLAYLKLVVLTKLVQDTK